MGAIPMICRLEIKHKRIIFVNNGSVISNFFIMQRFLYLNCILLFYCLLLSCQKNPSDDSTPVRIAFDASTRSTFDNVTSDHRARFVISEDIVRQFIKENNSSVVIRSIVPYEIDGDVSFYVVNLDNGWRIISSDARTQAVLAKGDSGSFLFIISRQFNS